MFRAWRFLFAVSAFVVLGVGDSYAQQLKQKTDTIPPGQEIDIFDMIRKWMKKPAKPIDTSALTKRNLSILPVIGYSPANGAVLGAAISVTKYMGDPKTTKLTAALINVSVTSKSQVILQLRYDLYTAHVWPRNKWPLRSALYL